MTNATHRADERVYLDHNATTPPHELVRTGLGAWFDEWGNPSSIHQSGRGPKALMRDARRNLAKMIGCEPLEVIFTSGGSESNNLAIKGVFETLAMQERDGLTVRKKYLFSSVEHPSVKRAAEYLAERGAEIQFIPVSRGGLIDLAAYEANLAGTALVSVMYANNETGNVFPIREMAALARKAGALFHSDCVQALGKIPVNVAELGVDLASFSAHKFYALKGAGALYTRRGVRLQSLIHGGGQERHRRGGTENVLAIAAFGAMCSQAAEVTNRVAPVERLRDLMEGRILAEIEGVTVTGSEGPRLPNTSSLVIAGVDGETLLMNLDMRGYSVSTGAACSSGSPEPSPVLLAMGLTRAEAQSSLRLTLGWSNSEGQIRRFVDDLVEVVAHLRSFNQSERAEKVHV